MENDVLKIVATALVTTMLGMVTWYLKGINASYKTTIQQLVSELNKVKEEMNDITYNYVTKFGEVRKDIYDLGATFSNHTDKISNHFERKLDEIKEVFEKHFLEKHEGVVSDVSSLKKKLAEIEKELIDNIRHMNEGAADFYKKHQSALDWIEQKRREEHEIIKNSKRKTVANV